jgi:hypothetical protein
MWTRVYGWTSASSDGIVKKVGAIGSREEVSDGTPLETSGATQTLMLSVRNTF